MTFVCYIINKFFSWLFFFGCKPVQSFVNLWGRIFTDLNELFFLQLALVISPSRKIFESERDVALWCERKTPRTRTTCQRVRILAVWTQFVVSTKWACCSALCKLWQLSEIKNLPFLKLSGVLLFFSRIYFRLVNVFCSQRFCFTSVASMPFLFVASVLAASAQPHSVNICAFTRKADYREERKGVVFLNYVRPDNRRDCLLDLIGWHILYHLASKISSHFPVKFWNGRHFCGVQRPLAMLASQPYRWNAQPG